MTIGTAVDARQFVAVRHDDARVVPPSAQFAIQCRTCYGGTAELMRSALLAYPAKEFGPPGGVLIVAVQNGVPVAGGAFGRYDSTTAERKRIWTASAHPFQKRLANESTV